MVRRAWILFALLPGCALADALSGDDAADADADTDADTDTDTGTGTDTGSDADTDTDTDTGSDLEDCFAPYRGEDVCEDQKDHAAECATRDPDYEAASCDPIDQCGCVSPQGCFPAYDAGGATNATVECADPGTGRVGDPCDAHTDCLAGLFCLNGQLTASGDSTCERPCDDPCDCPEDEVCIPYQPNFCRRPDLCDPMNPDACPAGQGCIYATDIANETFLTFCIRVFGDPDGAACDATNACEPGSQCAEAECRANCNTDEDCPEGGNCVPYTDPITGCDAVVRVCL